MSRRTALVAAVAVAGLVISAALSGKRVGWRSGREPAGAEGCAPFGAGVLARGGLRDHRLTVWRAGKAVMRARIGTGKALSPTPTPTPTPTGHYSVTDLLRPPNPRGFYGPYALGLSAHSTVYTSFAGGNGQVGIHGTNRPGALGQDVSAGCIRVRNRVITRLAKLLPLGTPVDVSRA